MEKDREYITRLFGKYIRNEISEEEMNFLFQEIRSSGDDDIFEKRDWIKIFEEEAGINTDTDWDSMLATILEDDVQKGKERNPKRRVYSIRRIAAAAAVFLLLIMAGIYFISPGEEVYVTDSGTLRTESPADILPGRNQAVLTLSTGKDIVLSDTDEGLLSNGEAEVLKVDDGTLKYLPQEGKEREETVYHTLSTPRGGQYHLTLTDGTKVWLNAASSIRYPVEFREDIRQVEVTGEVYFEVGHDENQPFVVLAGSSVIEDLGTIFNVKAYGDETEVRTTLIEGVVKVGDFILKPGEQTLQREDGSLTLLKNVNLAHVVSWKEGFFSFENADITEIMKAMARWYDLEVNYDGPIHQGRRFSGRIDRNLTLMQVLQGLKLTVADFDIESGNKIIIRN